MYIQVEMLSIGMETKEIVGYLDDLIFSSTGRHIDSLQLAILKGVFNGQKYADIAQEYNCTAGHAKDEAYKLWQLLSETLGEDINKSNFCSTIERLGFANFKSPIVGNRIKVNNINLSDDQILAESITKKTKRETIPRLVKLGLTVEQVSEVLDLPIQEVSKIIASQE
jgi:hypothetical protein